jgi:hypothetical protein
MAPTAKKPAGGKSAVSKPCPDPDPPEFTPPGSAPAAYLRQHRALASLSAVAGADGLVAGGHAIGWPWGYALVAAPCTVAAVRVAVRHARISARLAADGASARRLGRARARRQAAWASCAACCTAMAAGTAAGVLNGWGQLVMLGGGLAVAAPGLYRARKRPEPPPEPPAPAPAAPPPPDPRLTAFSARFGQSGPCKGARFHSLRDVKDGFALEIELPAGSETTTGDLFALIPKVAAQFDVSRDQVTVEYTADRSERRAIVTVLTRKNAWNRADKWDGKSTYDPATGKVRIGRYADGEDAHWLLHIPGSGVAAGILAGQQGSGKTGSLLVIACEEGQAKVDGKRIIALWMGDPQRQPLAVWKGFADQMAWGLEACVQMIIMAHALMCDRAARFGDQTWTDHLGRVNTGKGSFDPTPENPIIDVTIDEWPKIVRDPVLSKIAIPLVAAIIMEGRKVGVKVKVVVQMPDLTELGLRAIRELLKAFNVLSHRTDGLSKHMLGVQGDTSALAPGVHGLGFLHGTDNRPSTTMRTKHLPEYVKPGEDGPDVRELAEKISLDVVELGPEIEAVIRPLGWGGRLSVLDGSQLIEAIAALPDGVKDSQLPFAVTAELRRVVSGPGAGPRWSPPAQDAPAPRRHDSGDLPQPPESKPVTVPLLAAWLASRGVMDLYDVSQMADTDAFSADQALRNLVAVGVAEDLGGGRYRSLVNAEN